METVKEKIKLVKDDQHAMDIIHETFCEIFKILESVEWEDAIDYVNWMKSEIDMRYNLNSEKNFPLFSKGIYYVNLGKNIGAEIEKDRPCILLSGSKESETVIVIPISDEDKYIGSTFWYHIPLSSGDTALVEQIRTVSKTRIRRPIRLDGGKVRAILPDECKKVNNAIDKLKIFVKDN